MLFEIGYDMDSAFDETTMFNGYGTCNNVYDSQITFDTFLYLDNIGVDTLFYIDKVCLNFCYANDVAGLEFCLANGINADDIFCEIRNPVSIDIMKCLLDHELHIDKLNFDMIKKFMTGGNNSAAVIYLIENGLDTSDYLYPFLKFCIGRSIDIIGYFINSGIDINMMNKLLLRSCRLDNIDCVKFLLDSGADVHYDNNSILNFTYKYGMNYVQRNCFSISKLLIAYGAISNNPTYTFCLSIIKLSICNFDAELFTYLLDMHIDLNSKFDIDVKKTFMNNDAVEYILDAVVYFDKIDLFKLCLQHGADPYINNHSPLKISIKKNRLEIIKLLLDLGSVMDPELDYTVNQLTIDLLDQYQIHHKLKKIDK
jgi:ankyrin repeat protein